MSHLAPILRPHPGTDTQMKIGSFKLDSLSILAPMAGVTDKPFRLLCKEMGAGYAVSEMTTSDPRLWKTKKSLQRMDHEGEPGPIGVQIAGSVPTILAEAARYNVDHGAQIIDLNLGCPAKKVCNSWCGSALMQDELLVAKILEAIVGAVEVPVTLKIRTGWNAQNKNAMRIASIAEDAGIAMIAVHGRTRDMMYNGVAEHETVADIKSKLRIPVVVNGDIETPEKAKELLEKTKADAVMIGRAAQGRPWIFREINHYLETGERLPEPSFIEIGKILATHLTRLYDFYGEESGVRIARKHLGWYSKGHGGDRDFRATINRATSAVDQLMLSQEYFALRDAESIADQPVAAIA